MTPGLDPDEARALGDALVVLAAIVGVVALVAWVAW
jgi:hypothetical protein